MIKSGYAYILTGKDWRTSEDKNWETEMVSESSGEYVGYRRIDDVICCVYFKHGKYVAQVGHPPDPKEWR